jgi:hypothetical protein
MKASLVALLVVGAFSVGAARAAAGEKAQVTGVYQLYVREAPDLDATPIGVLAAGDVVEVVDQTGRWARVALKDGKTGYVSRKYLVPVEPPEQRGEGTTATEGSSRADAAAAELSAAERAGAGKPTTRSQGAPAPPSPPSQVGRGTRARRPPRRAAACTAADLKEIRRGLQEVAAGQEQLATLVDSQLAARPARGRGPSLAVEQGLVLVGVGCIVGWVVSRSYARRQRKRIRL